MSIVDEANRCLKCKKPMCSRACPVETPIPKIMELFLDGKIMEAGRILFENNPLSAVTSVVCPHESNCTGSCVLGKKGSPVNFFEIEEYISSLYLDTIEFKPHKNNGIMVCRQRVQHFTLPAWHRSSKTRERDHRGKCESCL